MANSSDWIARAAQADAPGAARPGWIAALALAGEADAGGFRDVSPFAPGPVAGASQAAEDPAAPPDTAEPEPAPEDDPHTQGYMRGFAEGHALAKRAGEEALRAEQERLRSLRLAFRSLDAAAMEALANDLNATVLALCEQVLGDYALDRAALGARCAAAARRLGAAAGELTLSLHPETRAALDPAAFADWTLVDDPALAPGALRLSGPQGAVRDGPEDWLRAFAEALGG